MTPIPKLRRRLNLPSGTVPIHTSLTPDTLHKVEAFIQRQEDKISRSEAIRRLVELGLKGRSKL